jgi:uncharacterized protein (UPF0548 family)
MIEVHFIRGDEYQVKVFGLTETIHKVTLRESDRLRLAGKGTSSEKLIEESYRFLLEREPNTSIMATFHLPVISRYFPEYERVVRERFS